jgi:SET domain-containing protein
MKDLEIKTTQNKGRGVFAARDFREGEIIEKCHIILCREADTELIDRTFLHNYYFNWGPKRNRVAITLGYGSLYNHSYEPNAVYTKDFENNMVIFRSLKPIKVGKEITVHYRDNPNDKTPVEFEVMP